MSKCADMHQGSNTIIHIVHGSCLCTFPFQGCLQWVCKYVQQAKWWDLTVFTHCIKSPLFPLPPWSPFSSIDRKPSTPLKEEICKKTNLSMRVVRVWFQNKRCKEKKDRLRQDGWDLVAAQQDTLPPTVSYMQHHAACALHASVSMADGLSGHPVFHTQCCEVILCNKQNEAGLVPSHLCHLAECTITYNPVSHYRRVQSSSILTSLTPLC